MTSIYKNRVYQNLLFSIGLGLASYIFGLVKFQIPGIEGAASGLNEAPLLVAVIYVSNPLYLLITTFIGSFVTPADGSFFSTFFSHLAGLIAVWYLYRSFIKGKNHNKVVNSLLFIVGILVYYFALVLPIMILTYQFVGLADDGFFSAYENLVKNASFEILATTTIATLYYLQYDVTNKLKTHLEQVEELVNERTKELDQAITELNSVNEELISINDSLDIKVKKRTEELENKNVQLSGYAFVNSHLLRAPLARILGLSQLIKTELTSFEDKQMLEMFSKSCEELDEIVKLLSKYLTEESVLDKNQLNELQEKIKNISLELREA